MADVGAPAGMDAWDFLLRLVDRATDADRWSVLVESDGALVVRDSTDASAVGEAHPRWRGLPGQAYASGTACVVDDAQDTRSAAASSTEGSASYRSLCCVPLDDGLLLGEARRPGAFEEADRTLVERFVATLGDALTESARPTAAVDGGRSLDDARADHAEEIADILSHDIKSPLNVVSGNLELARETGDEVYLEKALAALDRVEEIVDEVVLLAQTGERIDEREAVDLEAAARAAWETVEAEAAYLEVERAVVVDADGRALRHLLENLMDNAVVHGGDDVTVRVGPTDRGFYVEDDGRGVPEELRDRVFERGFSRERGTSGLGLHIVGQIAEAHDWAVRVVEAESGGARFEVDTEAE